MDYVTTLPPGLSAMILATLYMHNYIHNNHAATIKTTLKIKLNQCIPIIPLTVTRAVCSLQTIATPAAVTIASLR